MSVPLSVSVKLCKSSQAACLQHSESQTFARKEKSWKDLGQPRTFPHHIASICYFVLLMNFFNESLCDLASVLPLLWVCHTSSSRRFNFLSQLTRPFSGSASTWAESEHNSPTVLSAHQQQCLKWHPSTSTPLLVSAGTYSSNPQKALQDLSCGSICRRSQEVAQDCASSDSCAKSIKRCYVKSVHQDNVWEHCAAVKPRRSLAAPSRIEHRAFLLNQDT